MDAGPAATRKWFARMRAILRDTPAGRRAGVSHGECASAPVTDPATACAAPSLPSWRVARMPDAATSRTRSPIRTLDAVDSYPVGNGRESVGLCDCYTAGIEAYEPSGSKFS